MSPQPGVDLNGLEAAKQAAPAINIPQVAAMRCDFMFVS
jgi:hypothetical protein